MKYFLFLLIALALNTQAQFQLSNWELLTSHSIPSDATSDSEGNLWVSTSGGVYMYNPKDSTYQVYNKLNGLSDLQYTTVLSIPDLNWIICGSTQGAIDIFDLDENTILNVNDLKNFSSVGARINDLKYHDGIVYVSSNIGLSEFIPQKGEAAINQIFGDTYQKTGTKSSVIINDEIYILVENEGILKTQIGNIITDPSNWEKVDIYQATGSNIISMVSFEEEIYFHNNVNVWKLGADTVEVVEEINFYEFRDLFTYENSLYVLTAFSYTDIFTDQAVSDFEFGFTKAYEYFVNGESQLIMLTQISGIANYSDEKSIIAPNALGFNSIFDLDVEGDDIWATTGTRGTMHFDGNEWKYYFKELKDKWGNIIGRNGHRKVHISPNGNIYVGQKGMGLYEFKPVEDGEYEIEVFNDTNSIFQGLYLLPNDYQKGDSLDDFFTEAAEIETDNEGITWVVNIGTETPGYALIAKNGYDFYGFAENPGGICEDQDNRGYFHLEIDLEGTKWLGSDEASTNEGLLLFNENGTLEDDSDDICMTIRVSDLNELPDNKVTALSIDKNGWMWVGTPRGVVYFLNPGAIRFTNDPDDLVPVTAQIFDGINVVDIKVDAVNNKWIASTDEIKIFDPDGTELIATINSNNSPLPNSGINALEIKEETGEVFIGTETGLFKVKTLFSKPLEAYDFEIYPQPFNPNEHSELRINGLAGNSELRIIKPSGELVKVLEARGSETIWDGRNKNGKFVDSGVYLVIAGSEKNGSRAVGKFAVLKK